MKTRYMILTVLFALCSSIGMMAQTHFEVDLWNGKPSVKSSDKQDEARLYVFLPDSTKASGRAIVVCPGGAYEHLAMEHEGTDWAPFLNRQGIAVIVLKYRMPHGKREVPVSDAEQAIRMVRANAANWHIDPNDVGIMGFSAGGHLASTIATHSKGDAAPNFHILFYPVITMDPEFTHMGSHNNLLGEKPKKKLQQEYSNDLQVTGNTSRALIILSEDDDIVQPGNGINYFTQLYRHDVPASIFVYPTGGHGYGIRPTFAFHLEMLMNVKAWLDSF